jgi:hypothetical protein
VLNFINIRLSIPARLALIGALFIVPIVFVTAMVEPSSATSHSASNQAEQLTNLISRFQTAPSDQRNFSQRELPSAPSALARESRAGARRVA